MKRWKIDGYDFTEGKRLDSIKVLAESFDEALAFAKKINNWYSEGQIVERE